jgi:hypothetical protein
MLNPTRLAAENAVHAESGALAAVRRFDFRPAFLDVATMRIHHSRFADGQLAPFHVLDGLPDEVVVNRLPSGRVAFAKSTLIPGYERHGFFYTRTAATRACREWAALPRLRYRLGP